MAFNNGLILVFLLVRRRTLAQKLAKAARAQ
jgi:hypothetical protein